VHQINETREKLHPGNRTLPKGVKGQTLPAEVTATIPELRNHFYVTMKDQVLIVAGMSHKIIDIFSETQPVT